MRRNKVIAAYIQARMNSSRFPGKVLHELCGKPLLEYILDRVCRATGLDMFVVLTSDQATDDPIAEFCKEHGAPCFRGSLDNVAKRYLDALAVYPCDAFLRYCADSPLVDIALIERAVELFRQNQADAVTNIMPRTFPSGQCVEVVDARAFRSAYPYMRGDELEHCTLYFYNSHRNFEIINFESGGRYERFCHCVDTPEDHRRIARLVSGMDRPHWKYSWRDLLDLEKARRGA